MPRLGDLSVGEQQRVEILKALYNDARILILDEPTAVLTNIEAERLFATLKEMARQGLSLIFISHKLDEVMAAADRVVVLRGGKMVAERMAAETSKAELAELMVGHRVTRPVREPSTPGAVAAGSRRRHGARRRRRAAERHQFPAARRRDARHYRRLRQWPGDAWRICCRGTRAPEHPATPAVRAAGRRISASRMWSMPASAAFRRIATTRARSARWRSGKMPCWSASPPGFSRVGLVDRKAGMAFAEEIIDEFDVRGGGAGQPHAAAVGRQHAEAHPRPQPASTRPRILIAAQPTRGLDEGAVAAVHARILEARQAGHGGAADLRGSRRGDRRWPTVSRRSSAGACRRRSTLRAPIPQAWPDDGGRMDDRRRPPMRLERREHRPALRWSIAAPVARRRRGAGAIAGILIAHCRRAGVRSLLADRSPAPSARGFRQPRR